MIGLKRGVEGRFFFAKGPEEMRTHYLHIVLYKGELWNNQIMFRDWLIDNLEERNKYADLKKMLFGKFKNDREKYTAGKSDFIRRILKIAKDFQKMPEDN